MSTRINTDTRAALACALRIQGPGLETVALFGGFPSAAVEPGIYDRVGGRWVLRADGGTVALQHRPGSFGALGTPERNRRCPDCSGLGEVSIYPCLRCLGSGELRFNGCAAVPRRTDRAVRQELTTKRRAGVMGRKK